MLEIEKVEMRSEKCKLKSGRGEGTGLGIGKTLEGIVLRQRGEELEDRLLDFAASVWEVVAGRWVGTTCRGTICPLWYVT